MEGSQAQSQVDSATKATAVAANWADTGEFPAEIETVYSPCICLWDRELAMIAFDGWKSLHHGCKPQSRRRQKDTQRKQAAGKAGKRQKQTPSARFA